MWIRLIQELPVQKKYSPPIDSIFWAVPWLNFEQMQIEFSKYVASEFYYEDEMEKSKPMVVIANNITYDVFSGSTPIEEHLEKRKENLKHMKNRNRKESDEYYTLSENSDMFIGIYKEYFKGDAFEVRNPMVKLPHLKSPNMAGKMKIKYRGEDVGIFKHEYEEISAEEIIKAVDAGDYELIPEQAADIIVSDQLDTSLRPLVEEGMILGLTETQAKLAAMGNDVEDEIILPPVGWYKFENSVENIKEEARV